MKKYSVFFLAISILLLTQSTVGDATNLDTTKVGVSEGDSFSFIVEKLVSEGDPLDGFDSDLPFKEGDTITSKVIDTSVESVDELPAENSEWYQAEDLEHLVLLETAFANGSVEEEVSNLQQYGSLVVYTDWEYWTAQAEEQDGGVIGFGGEVTLTQDENSFTTETSYSFNNTNFDGELEVSEFSQFVKYEKSSGVFERIEFKISNNFSNGFSNIEFIIQRKSSGGGNLLEDLPGFELPLIGAMIFSLAILRRRRD